MYDFRRRYNTSLGREFYFHGDAAKLDHHGLHEDSSRRLQILIAIACTQGYTKRIHMMQTTCVVTVWFSNKNAALYLDLSSILGIAFLFS